MSEKCPKCGADRSMMSSEQRTVFCCESYYPGTIGIGRFEQSRFCQIRELGKLRQQLAAAEQRAEQAIRDCQELSRRLETQGERLRAERARAEAAERKAAEIETAYESMHAAWLEARLQAEEAMRLAADAAGRA